LSSSAQTAVVCDTTAYLPEPLLDERGIRQVSLYVSIDDQQEDSGHRYHLHTGLGAKRRGLFR
jgi:fatty acid-binding protein DegV